MLSPPDNSQRDPYRSSLEARQLNTPSDPGLPRALQSMVWAHPVYEYDDNRNAGESATADRA